MDNLKVQLVNCFGISALNEIFDFTSGKTPTSKAYAIYAPNGLMKTSFSKTFDALSKEGGAPREERFNRQPSAIVEVDNIKIHHSQIYVVKSEIDTSSENEAVSNILINYESKARYDALISNLNTTKSKLLSALQKKSKVRKEDIDTYLKNDFQTNDFEQALVLAKKTELQDSYENFTYNEIFDPKIIAVLGSPEFLAKSNDFNERYQELFNQSGTIYSRGIFNPAKADTSFTTLNKQGYFAGGHKVHLRGDSGSIGYDELQEKLRLVHESIDGDHALKKLRENLAKNAQTQALFSLLENITTSEVELLLHHVKPSNQSEFRRILWAFYVQNCSESDAYLEVFSNNVSEMNQIEQEAAVEAPRWSIAVELFNNRFVDMPFTLSLFNQVEASLGRDKAKLKFTFKDGDDIIECTREEIKSLSQGEKRALYLLNFIFEVEDRKRKQETTLFIIDDIADSFDYKNKHAIVQYLQDLTKHDLFRQIILTHNFDFFRTLASNFVHRDRCLMANRTVNGITLSKAEGVKNYFIGKWKENVLKSDFILCATVPFVRNLIEYIRGEEDDDYLSLTSLLHWKEATKNITVGAYFEIYNRLFGTDYPTDRNDIFFELIFSKAEDICNKPVHDGLNLEDKVLLSIAIRMRSEIFLLSEMRKIKNDPNYWCESNSQFGYLIKSYAGTMPDSLAIKTLEKVSVTVSTNIHLNSFMYEPILDLTIEHLISLYRDVSILESQVV